MKRITALVLICVCVLSSCNILHSGIAEDTGFYDKSTGIRYVICSDAVTPMKPMEEYAKAGGTKYLTIQFQDPLEFLSDDGEFYKYVYRAEHLPEFDIGLFNPVAADLYLDGEVYFCIDQLIAEEKYLPDAYKNGDEERDSEYTYAIRDTILYGESVGGDLGYNEVDESYTVHIELKSADYPGLYYRVVFLRGIDGNNYLYDTGSGKRYICPANVVYRFWANV
ncbi:hypothetical protein LJB90_03040 [Eubacteriales bacterium OttesenSCG-928-G02]|nr:hypothetical protein [Eubacteriales bacterium OttesenSCG-928-G02]